jgi:SAM-dependent methyltransferase
MERFAIFVTGAAILALQLIASRIMVPFFGVSLYIWTGILSITLLCLAFGYYVGGIYSRNTPKESLHAVFYFIPALSSVALLTSALVYPITLGGLARISLMGGTFVASIILLSAPLVAMSALNPILVAIERSAAEKQGDAGAGWVFFVSTIGSVFGVIVAAFCLIPYFSNQLSMLMIATTLGVLTLGGVTVHRDLPRRLRVTASVLAGLGVMGSAIIAGSHIAKNPSQLGDVPIATSWTVVASYPSAFGSLKVVDAPLKFVVGVALPQTEGERGVRLMLNDGMFQDGIFADGSSAFLFSHLLETVATNLVPEPRRVLVLGLGAGLIPGYFARRGAQVDVVEINAQTLRVAKAYFGYNPGKETKIYIEDARTFVTRCDSDYDVVLVDLFVGDGVPEHLLTKEFFDDVRRCLSDTGVFGMNSLADNVSDLHRHILSTATHSLGRVALISEAGQSSQSITSAFLFAARHQEALDKIPGMKIYLDQFPPSIASEMSMLSLQFLTPDSSLIAGVPYSTDENNRVAIYAAPAQMLYRKLTIEVIPDFVLAN